MSNKIINLCSDECDWSGFYKFLKYSKMRVRSKAYRRGSFGVFLEFVKTRNGSRGTK